MSSNHHRRVRKEEFAQQLHSQFSIGGDEGAALPAELVQLSEGPPAPGYEQFSLLFRIPAEVSLAQAIRRVGHPVLGEQSLFLVPVDRDSMGLYLEAVFNRHAEPASMKEDA
jgi:hypothetical protein